jgi:hypothetical protein
VARHVVLQGLLEAEHRRLVDVDQPATGSVQIQDDVDRRAQEEAEQNGPENLAPLRRSEAEADQRHSQAARHEEEEEHFIGDADLEYPGAFAKEPPFVIKPAER